MIVRALNLVFCAVTDGTADYDDGVNEVEKESLMRNGRIKRGRNARANVLFSTGLHSDRVLETLILICFLVSTSLSLSNRVSYYFRIPSTARILDLPRCHRRRQSKGFSSSQDLLRKSIKI
ncbi:Plant phosphoribosyltransferase C-terminal [Musa troglodytarum]|uniref:Plant phosphoribosyltransferase C-terminal n=1 Tax=Musa troglodytarum TaxID=320322 RepID=A0A9E7EZW9_9LILI|nr:Plant phosphoribosyltransferase C-terminal [Musa troglodytarum]